MGHKGLAQHHALATKVCAGLGLFLMQLGNHVGVYPALPHPLGPILLQAVKNMFVQIEGLYTNSAPEYCV